MRNIFSAPVEIRFRDIDAMRHVNHAVFLTYFEEGRKKLFNTFGRPQDPAAFNIILARIECDYLKPIKLRTKANIQVWVKEIGTKSFTLAYRILDAENGDVYAKGESVQVCFNYKDNQSKEIPEELKERLESYFPH